MPAFQTLHVSCAPAAVAPDLSRVRVLLRLAGGSMAHFELPARHTSAAVVHRTVEELWYFVSGRGEMWRRSGERSDVTALEPGLCITLPVGTQFQFRALGDEALRAVAVTMPPWPGDDEAQVVPGPWTPTPASGS